MARDRRSIRQQPKARAGVDRWLDWTLSTLQPVDRPVFWALVRTPPEKRDMVAIQKDADAEAVVWRIVEAQLATRRFIEGDQFTIADIALGAFARRWFGVEGVTKPKLPNLERWFAQIREPPRLCAVHRAADDVSDPSLSASRWTTPAPMLTAPPIFMQVLVPSILTKPAPYSAHELADVRALQRKLLAGSRGFDPTCECAAARRARQPRAASAAMIIRRNFRIPPFIVPCSSELG